jgi:IS30 family transposase
VPRSCTVCTHPDRAKIDEALVAGVSSAEIAGRYRTIGERAIRRHRTNHLPETLAKAHEAEEVAQADNLLAQVRDLQERALDILDEAEEGGELTL